VSSHYEHASLILTSNLPFARRGDGFGDQIVASAMIDRIVHHAEVVTLNGSSCRLRNTNADSLKESYFEKAEVDGDGNIWSQTTVLRNALVMAGLG